jgi:P4 family phage/plasmid primase-like protien
MSIADTTPEEDVALAYKIMKECLDPEKRAGDYYDWVRVAICLKNIANTEASFEAWVDLTRRVDPSHTKATRSDAELRSKWNVIRIGGDAPKLTIASLISWAKEDNPKKLDAIQDVAFATWIINFAKDTHVNVAKFVKRCYRHDYRCSVGAKRNNYEWYHYPKGFHSWKHLKTSTLIRQKLSEEVKNHYVNAQMELGRRHNLPENLTNSAEKERIDDKRKKLMGIESKLENTSFKDSVMKECQETFYDEEFVSKLNINPFLVGVANGVLELNYYDDDLKRLRVNFRPGLPDDNISFQMGHSEDKDAIPYYPYNPEEPEQIELMNFFKKIYPDEILRKYVLTLLGSCLEGQNKEQKFFVNQGAGSNGKSMIQILMDNTFGDYQTSLHTAILTRKRADAGSANPDLITMKCKRYMYMNEPDNGEKLNTANMKQMSGEDKIQARGLFSDQEKFSVMGKIFMSCNDLPPVGTMDNGTWRRIRVIPHTSTFKDPGDPAIDPSKHIYEKDFHLTSKILKWRTAFLSLLVHYYDTVYLVHGIQEPDIVKAASDKYKETNDVFMTFFTENFVVAQGEGPIHSKEVKKIFREWKKHLGRACDLKEQDVVERMAKQCGGTSTDKEFWNVRVQTDDDTQNLMITE